jgi:GNAT superfamily N-acetyltransferase
VGALFWGDTPAPPAAGYAARPVLVREATPDDYPDIARLTVAAYRALPTWVGDDYAKELADVAGRAAAGATVLVAEDEAEGRLLGSVTLVLERGSYFEWCHGVDGDCGFRMLAVDPEAWGRGVGPVLVAECLRRARAAGRRRMIIGSTSWMTTAHRIYERLGFVRRPELDQQWGDITGWAFVLDLDEVRAEPA